MRSLALACGILALALTTSARAGVPDLPATSAEIGQPFHLNQWITVTASQGPVSLRAAQFRQARADEMETALDFHCDEGKDQQVTYEVTLLDTQGAVVLTIKGRKGIEETDNTTFKQKQKVSPGLLDSVRTFKVTFTSQPD